MGRLLTAILVAATIISAMPMIVPSVKATDLSRSPPSFWVEPETENFNTATTPVGTLFNVTVWGSTPVNDSKGLPTFSWQVNLGFNTSQLQAVKAGYTAGATSELFAGHTTIPVKPVITNTGNGSVLAAESLLAGDSVGAENASLFWAEFNVTAAPSAGQTFTCNIDPAYGLTQKAGTEFLDTTPAVESGLSTAYCVYSYALPPALMSVYPSSLVIPPGGNVTVAVTVTNSTNLYAWSVAIEYNASVTNCSAAWIPKNNVFRGQTTNQTGPTINAPTTDGLNYTLIGLSLLSGSVNVSSGTMFNINFTAVESGETTIQIGTEQNPITTASGNQSSFLLDPDMNEMPFVEQDGQASVGSSNVTISPTTNLELTFANVTAAGAVAANATLTVNAPTLNNTVGLFYAVNVTAGFSGNVTVTLAFNGSGMTQQQKSSLQMMQYTPIPGNICPPWGVCDITDVAYVASLFGINYSNPKYNPNADINGDGAIDITDVAFVAAHFGLTATWINITTHVDTTNNIIYGTTTHFSFICIK
jgi:hypothetical protein